MVGAHQIFHVCVCVCLWTAMCKRDVVEFFYFSLQNVHFNLIISAVDQRVNVKMQAQAKFKSQCKIDASLSAYLSLVFLYIQMQKLAAICVLNVIARARKNAGL